jgi:hypothetical protein
VRHDPSEINVTCDGEGFECPQDCMIAYSDSSGIMDANLRIQGWWTDGDNDYCPECAKARGLVK